MKQKNFNLFVKLELDSVMLNWLNLLKYFKKQLLINQKIISGSFVPNVASSLPGISLYSLLLVPWNNGTGVARNSLAPLVQHPVFVVLSHHGFEVRHGTLFPRTWFYEIPVSHPSNLRFVSELVMQKILFLMYGLIHLLYGKLKPLIYQFLQFIKLPLV